jgi:hypothetical protein
MSHTNPHIPDDELLLAAEGELAAWRARQVSKHLDACSTCRERRRQLERTARDAFRAYHSELDPATPSSTAARSALRAQLREMSDREAHSSWFARVPHLIDLRTWAYVCGLLLLTAVGINALHRQTRWGRALSQSYFAYGPVVPDARLTPGAVRAMSVSEVCMLQSPAESAQIPSNLKRLVFHEYGMDGAPTLNYEVDHLITPALGGTDDIRNLWPESYTSEWNARVKDQLENRLHELVCDGKIDLPTAQRDIASNWISAYQKYFHTDRPLPSTSRLVHSHGARLWRADLDS